MYCRISIINRSMYRSCQGVLFLESVGCLDQGSGSARLKQLRSCAWAVLKFSVLWLRWAFARNLLQLKIGIWEGFGAWALLALSRLQPKLLTNEGFDSSQTCALHPRLSPPIPLSSAPLRAILVVTGTRMETNPKDKETPKKGTRMEKP